MLATAIDVAVETLDVSTFTVPTDEPESDGTASWDSTTLVLAEAHAGGTTGLGYTYGAQATGALIANVLAPVVEGRDALAVGAAHDALARACRNLGRPGVASIAIAAVDTALWDLKARLLDLPLAVLLDAVRTEVPVYGSGGFTSLSTAELQEQLGGWAAAGIPRVKMKVGRDPEHDLERVRAAREAIGPETELFVDANGAYDRKQALRFAEAFASEGVVWFEEPVTADDLAGLAQLRDRAPMEIAAGEYGYLPTDFLRLLDVVDCLQADATRCEGYTGFLGVAALCEARSLPLSAHTAPALHAHVCCAAPRLRHLEWFSDHVRVEQLLFDGLPELDGGVLRPDFSRPGNGLELRRADAERFRT
jgi:L-alanine-DL-glutamate epimerase-like enolase superfamily enzyme